MRTAPWWVEHRFPAMGAHVHVMLWGTEGDASWAEHEVARLEARWSRSRPCSDVARINRAAGRGDVAVTPETVDLLVDACAWWRATDGWFDPTVLHAPAPGCAGIDVDRGAGVVAIPAEVGIDLGGIAKGAAADRVAAGLKARGIPAAWVSMGREICAFGRDWAIPVPSTIDPARVLFTHIVDDGALVTCTDHHVVDPTTGQAAETGLSAVMVAADSTAQAAVLAKAAFVAGPERGAALLLRHGVDGWFVDTQGRQCSETRTLALATS